MRARAECGSSKRASGQLTIIVRGLARGCLLYSTLLPFLRIIFSNANWRPITAAGRLGAHTRGHSGMLAFRAFLQPPVTRESLVQRLSQIRFPHGGCVSICDLVILSGAVRQPRGSVMHTKPFRLTAVYCTWCTPSHDGMAQRVPTDPGPCHACRDEGGHLVAHLGQGLSSCISARQANKATVGPVPCPCRNDALDASANLNAWAREQRAEDRRYA